MKSTAFWKTLQTQMSSEISPSYFWLTFPSNCSKTSSSLIQVYSKKYIWLHTYSEGKKLTETHITITQSDPRLLPLAPQEAMNLSQTHSSSITAAPIVTVWNMDSDVPRKSNWLSALMSSPCLLWESDFKIFIRIRKGGLGVTFLLSTSSFLSLLTHWNWFRGAFIFYLKLLHISTVSWIWVLF